MTVSQRSRLVPILRRIAFAIAAMVLAASAAAGRAEAFPSIVVDVASGRVIAHNEAFQRWYPASLTKLMLMYVVFRGLQSGELSLDTPITMTAHAAGEPPAKMYFKPGSQLTLDAAMKILMVKSANDVAMAVAESIGGSEAAFVQRMNAEAARLGMFSTHFVNPNGLPETGQYTTARDLAVLAVALRREFPQYAPYFALEGIQTGKRAYKNFNLLIGRYDGADGMKTGFICASGFNQISSATRNGRTVLSVVLGTDSLNARTVESANLLEAAFRNPAGFGAPTLATLKPYGANRDVVADVSDAICSKQASAHRSEGRDESGKLKLNSPYIHEMDHAPRLVAANLLGTVGNPGTMVANVPIPTPKPEMGDSAGMTAFVAEPPVAANAGALATMPQGQGSLGGVPVPLPRPGL